MADAISGGMTEIWKEICTKATGKEADKYTEEHWDRSFVMTDYQSFSSPSSSTIHVSLTSFPVCQQNLKATDEEK